MAFEIIWSEPAIRQLRKLDRTVARRIFNKVGELADNPHRLVQRLVSSPYYRVRVGDYRVILDIQQRLLRILVLKIGHRGSIYGRYAGWSRFEIGPRFWSRRFKFVPNSLMRWPPGSSERDIAVRPTDLLPRRLDGHAGDLLFDGFFDVGFQRSPHPHRDSAHLTTPRPNKLTVHQERTRPHGLGP